MRRHGLVRDATRILRHERRERVAVQQAVLGELLEADEPRVPGERRLSAVRRLAVSGGAQRQHLPPALRSGREKLDEAPRAGPDVSAPVQTGEARRVKKHAARALAEGRNAHRRS